MPREKTELWVWLVMVISVAVVSVAVTEVAVSVVTVTLVAVMDVWVTGLWVWLVMVRSVAVVAVWVTPLAVMDVYIVRNLYSFSLTRIKAEPFSTPPRGDHILYTHRSFSCTIHTGVNTLWRATRGRQF